MKRKYYTGSKGICQKNAIIPSEKFRIFWKSNPEMLYYRTMNTAMEHKLPELLAPAGNLACALAAFDAGADAVYAGLKRFNARERTENFSQEEMAKLIAYAHRNGKKVYVTFNTLVKESELIAAAEEIAELDTLRPDALIVQDLGIVRLIREYFPALAIHGSTQMGLNNSAGLAFAKELGLSRVILERQTTLEELEQMMKSGPPVEVELFIHGALCCCISGTCLLSSWLGGWSGNRGKCKQPCRRRHHSKNGNGFFLSSQDLCTLEILPRILKTGVSSLKIEGRLRRADYVENVVSAYRMAMNAKSEEEFRELLPAAKERLSHTCGRRWSLGYYTQDSAKHLIKYDAMGVSGLLCGKVIGHADNGFKLSASRRISLGDTIRIQPQSGDEGPALCITKMSVNGKPVSSVSRGETCFIHSDKEVPRGGIVYKISERVNDFSKRIAALPAGKPHVDLHVSVSRREFRVQCGGIEWKKELALQEAGTRPLLPENICREFEQLSFDRFSCGKVSATVSENPFLPASVFKSLRHEFRDYLDAHGKTETAEEKSKKNLARFRRDYDSMHGKKYDRQWPDCAILPRGKHPEFPEKMRIVREIGSAPSPHEELLLPFFVNETSLDNVRNAIREYVGKGGKVIRISSLHHLALLKGLRNIVIKTCMPMPVCNSMAVQEAAQHGIALVQAWLELEKPELEAMIAKSVLPVELYRYGRPPLLSTRAEIAAEHRMSDLRGETFFVERDGLLTQIMAEKVMSIPSVRGAAAGLYDLRHANFNEKNTARFNFDFRLE